MQTNRLILSTLNNTHSSFILELLNTKGWLQFIGDRKIKTADDANAYINKITGNNNITYWVVQLKDVATPIGLITLIKRDYLSYQDIGFAFLPQYEKQGYAFEAAKSVLNTLLHKTILGITNTDNTNSIKLLEKLGLHFSKKITVENEELLVYSL